MYLQKEEIRTDWSRFLIHFLEYPIPPLSVTFFCVQWISGTESRIIDPLVAKRPRKKSEIKKSKKNLKQTKIAPRRDKIVVYNYCILYTEILVKCKFNVGLHRKASVLAPRRDKIITGSCLASSQWETTQL